MFKDYYAVLGVPRTATDRQIRSAYARLVKTIRPDIDKSAGAVERFKEVQAAYEAIGRGGLNQEARTHYDQDFDREMGSRSTNEGPGSTTSSSTRPNNTQGAERSSPSHTSSRTEESRGTSGFSGFSNQTTSSARPRGASPRKQPFSFHFRDYYSILTIPTNATNREIQQAYEKLSRRYNPNNWGEGPDKLREVQEAYEKLGMGGRKPENKASYDRSYNREMRSRQTRRENFSPTDESTLREEDEFKFPYTILEGYREQSGIVDYNDTGLAVPINDLGFTNALIKAYKEPAVGKAHRWKVRKHPDDERSWIPEIVYEIYKTENGDIEYKRIIDDWVNKDDLGGNAWTSFFLGRIREKPLTLVDLKRHFADGSSQYWMPECDLRGYYLALDRLSRHKAGGDFNMNIIQFENARDDISDFMRARSNLYRRVGHEKGNQQGIFFRDGKYLEEESTGLIPLREFWKVVGDAEGRVFKESIFTSSPENKG